ncbi:receptor-transporting protein 4-like [Argonauta hians]
MHLLNEIISYIPPGIPAATPPTPIYLCVENNVNTNTSPVSIPSSSMEMVWHGEFDRLFCQYLPDLWCLLSTNYPPSNRWRTFKDSAKVRFSCQQCGHGWTSMKGRVIFWFHLNFATSCGYVMFKLYGQQCMRCNNGCYEPAMWYPEEVVKVIGNVYNRIGQLHYGFVRPPLRIDRRAGKPRNQHNADLCQACKEGLCKEEWSFS